MLKNHPRDILHDRKPHLWNNITQSYMKYSIKTRKNFYATKYRILKMHQNPKFCLPHSLPHFTSSLTTFTRIETKQNSSHHFEECTHQWVVPFGVPKSLSLSFLLDIFHQAVLFLETILRCSFFISILSLSSIFRCHSII